MVSFHDTQHARLWAGPAVNGEAPPLTRTLARAHTLRLRHTQHARPLWRAAKDRWRTVSAAGERFAVRELDNLVHTYGEGIDVSRDALGVSSEAAFNIAHAIDAEGSYVECVAAWPEAERIAAHIETIGIEALLEPAGESFARS